MTVETRSHDLHRRSMKALLLLMLVVAMFFYAFRIAKVQGDSMHPTFRNGQWLLVRRHNWPSPPLRVGDVVVFRLEDDILVKRIAAMGGQVVPAMRPMIVFVPSHQRPGHWDSAVVPSAPLRVPPDQLYVLGDNALVSDDSRNFGPVPVSTLLGRVLRWKDPGPPPKKEADRQATR
jgi:signal peptidase I